MQELDEDQRSTSDMIGSNSSRPEVYSMPPTVQRARFQIRDSRCRHEGNRVTLSIDNRLVMHSMFRRSCARFAEHVLVAGPKPEGG